MTTLRLLLLAALCGLTTGCGAAEVLAIGAYLHESSKPVPPPRPLVCHTRTSRTDTTTDTATWCE
jgi:hypothetical protein